MIQNKELDELITEVNESILYVRAMEEIFDDDDTILAICDNCLDSFDKLLDTIYVIFNGDYYVERENRSVSCSLQKAETHLEDAKTTIENWTIPDNLLLDEDDQQELQTHIKNYIDFIDDLLNTIYDI